MSFLRKMLGKDPAALRAEADALYERKAWGDAKMAYLRLVDRLGDDAPEAQRSTVRERIGACQTELVRRQLAEVDRLRSAGEVEQAVDLCRAAIEMADGLEVKTEVKARADALTEDLTRSSQPAASAPDEEEIFSALSGSWSDEQAEELESYGDAFRTAFLALHNGKPDEARDAFREIRGAHPDGLYVRIDLARAIVASHRRSTPAGEVSGEEAKVEARAALEEARDLFGSYLDDEPEDASLELFATVQSELAQVLLDLDDPDGAERCLLDAAEATYEQTYGHLNLGRFYRGRKRYDDAVKALDVAVEKMGTVTPDVRVYRELGFAHRDAGHKEEAADCLQAVVDHQASLGSFDFDPEAANALAELRIEAGDKESASDLYRHLARGRDLSNRFRYYLLAGKLLKEIGRKADGVRELHAARAIAPDDACRAEVDGLLGGAGAPKPEAPPEGA